ncbi:MAG: cation:proton antiporter [Pseudomonadales bacterium]
MEESATAYTVLLAAICGFFFLVATVRHYAASTPLPAESWLLLAGIAYGLAAPRVAALPAAELNPQLVVMVLLPVLVFAGARRLPVTLLLPIMSPVALLVLVGTPLTMLAIGLSTAWLFGFPYEAGLLFGAAVATIDPAAVSRVLDRYAIPERLKLLLHAESIFGDAIAIVAFIAMAAAIVAHAELSIGTVFVTAVRGALLAVPVGLLLGWTAALLVRHWHEENRVPGLTLTLILPFAGYLLSERLLHASGIIAVLCAALAFRHTRRVDASERPELYDQIWTYFGSLSASILYFALGAAIAAQTFVLDWRLPTVILALLLSRAALAYGSGWLLRARGRPLPRAWRHVIMLGGMRGAVPAALILMMPTDYPYRSELLALVFVLVGYTLIAHPLLLSAYLQRHRISALTGSAEGEHDLTRDTLSAASPGLARRLQSCAWGIAATAGVAAGTVFILLEMTLVPLLQGASPWAPVRMIAAIGMGPAVLPPPAIFAGDVLLVAMVVHYTLSLVYAWLLAPLIEGMGWVKATLSGAVFGLGLYLINFYVFTAMFPWFAQARTGVTIFAHLVFGAVLAATYISRKPQNMKP